MRVPFVDLRTQRESIASEVQAAITSVMERGDFVLGADVERFEAEFAEYLGAVHAVGVGSGGAALELALRAYGIGGSDEVITAANTFVATVLAIVAVGARPVLVDVDSKTLNMDPDALAAAITPRTRAVIPVHLYGQPADLDRILAVAARHHLVVIEDTAQAHGARYHGRRAGTFGHAAAFSFYPSKNLGAYGDGGLVATNDARIAETLRMLRNYGQRAKYHHAIVGTNSRLDTLQAAILRVKLGHLDHWNCCRQEHAARYDRLLSGLPIEVPVVAPAVEHVFHLYVIQADARDELQRSLRSEEIETGIHYPVPVHCLEACTDLGYRRGAFPVTEAAAQRILSLPMYAELTSAQIERVCAALDRAVARV